MPAALHLKPEEVDAPDKRAKFTASIVGCGLRGVFYALSFAEAGFKVTCVDADQSVVKQLSKGNFPLASHEIETKLKGFTRKEKMTATNELKSAVAQSDVIVVTANARGEDEERPNYVEAASYCKQIGVALQKESLVIYGKIAGLGFIEGTVKENIENTSGLKAGEDFGLAYCPLSNVAIQDAKLVGDQEVVVAATDKTSLNSAITVVGTLTKKAIKATTDMKTAELAMLFQTARHDVNVALANELAVICENAGVDYTETLKLAEKSLEISSVMPTIAQEDSQNEAYLLDSADNLNVKLRLPALARQINEDMAKHTVSLVQEALRGGDKTLRRARIAIIGTANLPASKFTELLEAKGAKISIYDPHGSESVLTDTGHVPRKTINEAVEGSDCVVILLKQEQFRLSLKKLKAIMKSPAAIVDLAGTIEPCKAQEEGFVYRGLGKGAWRR